MASAKDDGDAGKPSSKAIRRFGVKPVESICRQGSDNISEEAKKGRDAALLDDDLLVAVVVESKRGEGIGNLNLVGKGEGGQVKDGDIASDPREDGLDAGNGGRLSTMPLLLASSELKMLGSQRMLPREALRRESSLRKSVAVVMVKTQWRRLARRLHLRTRVRARSRFLTTSATMRRMGQS